jgi:hypothetical protein
MTDDATNGSEATSETPTRPLDPCRITSDRIGFVLDSDGNVVPLDKDAARLMSKVMKEVEPAFKRLDTPKLNYP